MPEISVTRLMIGTDAAYKSAPTAAGSHESHKRSAA